MNNESNNPSSHTKNKTGKQPKQKKQTPPKPQVWCKILRRHTHTKKKQNNSNKKTS